jgi:hypothetical protein
MTLELEKDGVTEEYGRIFSAIPMGGFQHLRGGISRAHQPDFDYAALEIG